MGYLGLGSNTGDRRRQLQGAVDALAAQHVRVLASSSVYETEPVGEVLDQPDFLNACLKVETELSPEDLLAATQVVERALGRTPGGPRHGPRPIDVDLLLLDEVAHESAQLRLPHPELTARRFVLVALVELDPDLVTPGGVRLADALSTLGAGQAVRLAGPPLALRD